MCEYDHEMQSASQLQDRSDERDCAILILENEYNKRVPPMIPIRGVVKNGLFTDRKGEGGPRL